MDLVTFRKAMFKNINDNVLEIIQGKLICRTESIEISKFTNILGFTFILSRLTLTVKYGEYDNLVYIKLQ